MLLSCSFSGRSKLALRWCIDHSKSRILFPVYLYRGTPRLFLPNAMLRFCHDESKSENELFTDTSTSASKVSLEKNRFYFAQVLAQAFALGATLLI